MRVLLSVKPEFAARIFEGKKKYEFRKTIFRRQDIDEVLVYASKPVSLIVGEFEIDKILHDDINNLWTKTEDSAGIGRDTFFEYFKDSIRGYAIKIKSSKKYHAPLQLSSLMISVPPQSFRYLHEARIQTSDDELCGARLDVGSSKHVMPSNLVYTTKP